MTRKQFLEAVHKGHGRAVIAVQSGEYQPLFRDLVKLVIRWPGYDYQLEPSREWYVVEIIRVTPYFESLMDLATRFIAREKGSWRNASHRVYVITEFARRGFPQAKSALYKNFDPFKDLRLADEIIEIDGLSGLDLVLAQSNRHLSSENAWRFGRWIEEIEKTETKETVTEWLDKASRSRPEVAESVRLRDCISGVQWKKPHSLENLTFQEVLSQWDNQRRWLCLASDSGRVSF
jgi:hypothetical protein